MPLTIRLATLDDAPAVAAIYAPYCVSTPISFEETPPSAAEVRARIAKVLPRFPWLVAEVDGESVGYAYGTTHRERAAYRWSVEVSAYIAQGQHRRGLGKALYTSLLALLRLQGLYNAVAGITLPNPGSVALHEAVGFTPVGVYRHLGWKLGAWHDVGWWELLLQPLPAAQPTEARMIDEVRDRPGWQEALEAGQRLWRP